MAKEKKTGRFVEKLTPAQKVLSGIGLVLCVIFGFTLLCNLIIIVKGSLFPEQPPSVFGVTPMVVLSGSMSGDAEDHIEVGDLIFIDKAEPEDLKEGDVIAFMSGKTVVTHRIIEIRTEEGLSFITKGDANNAPDRDPVTGENLVGIYKSRIPKVGDFVLFLKEPMGMLLFIGVPVLIYIGCDLFRRQKLINQQKERNAQLQAELARMRRKAVEQGEPTE